MSLIPWFVALFVAVAARQWPRVHPMLFSVGALLAGYACGLLSAPLPLAAVFQPAMP